MLKSLDKTKKIIVSIFMGLFLLLMFLVIFDKISFLDNWFYNLLMSFRCGFLDNYFTGVTRFGDVGMVMFILLLFLIIFKDRRGIFLNISAIASVGINYVLKLIIRRDRPNGLRLVEQGGFSFPSGHTMISVCVYGYLLYIVKSSVKNKFLRYFLSILLVILILSIGISRVYVGVHYFSDVLAGYLLASVILILVIVYTNKYFRGK